MPFRLGAVYQRANRLHDRVVPVLRQLVVAGTESPSFHIRHDAKFRLCVFRVDSQHSTLDRVEAGRLFPLDRGAAGRVILAFDGERGDAFGRIRANFVEASFGERDPDCAGIASPVFGPEDKLIGALSVSGPKTRFNKDTIRLMSDLVLDGAVHLTLILGGRNDAMIRLAELRKSKPVKRSA